MGGWMGQLYSSTFRFLFQLPQIGIELVATQEFGPAFSQSFQ